MAEKKRKPSKYNLHVRDYMKANPGATMAEAAAAYKGGSTRPPTKARPADSSLQAGSEPRFHRGHIRRGDAE